MRSIVFDKEKKPQINADRLNVCLGKLNPNLVANGAGLSKLMQSKDDHDVCERPQLKDHRPKSTITDSLACTE